MAALLFLGDKNKDGLAPIIVRVQSKKYKIQIRQQIGLLIAPSIWDKRDNEREMKKYSQNPIIMKALKDSEEIRLTINEKLDNDVILNKDDVREIINSVVYRQQREEEAAAAAEAARLEAEANRVTLRKFIEQFRKDIKAGKRLTDKGTVYAPGTINAINQACERLKKFEKKMKREYDFDDIDMNFYRDYTAYLNEQGYAINTTGKCIKQLKAIMALAQSEGLHSNSKYQDKRFKGTRIEVDNVYLTREELDKIMALKYEGIHSGHGIARDIFMVGVWTAQRVSDYNNLSKDSIHTYTKRTIADVPDPENPGKTKPVVVEKDITYIDIKQQKTGAQVAIPCSSQLLEILKKYDFQMPHLEDQVINRYLKEICKDAGIDQLVQIEVTNGGTPKKVWKPKYELVHTHTARRTGATLMYLAGMDIYDIMKITGHSTPIMLKKYIKADELEVVDKITDKYDYFD